MTSVSIDALPSATRALIQIGRRALDPSAAGKAPVPCPAGELERTAARHGMTAWVAVPPRRAVAVESLAAIADLLAATGALADRGIRSIAIKGPVFSAWLYGDVRARRPGDLDLLVPRRARAKALEIFLAAGYSLPSDVSVAAARIIYGSLGAWPLYRTNSFPLDIHWRLAHRRFAAPLDPEAVFGDAMVVRAGGHEFAAPAPSHAALIAFTHAAQHVWSSLELVFALAWLLRRADVDWEFVSRTARRAGAWNGVAAGARLAAIIFGAAVPRPLEILKTNPHVDALCNYAFAALAMPPQVFHDRLSEWAAHRSALDSAGRRLRYDIWRLLAPTVREWEWWRLPAPLVPLYVPIRVIRLALKR